MTDKIKLTDAEWRERLTPEQYKILRKADTIRTKLGVSIPLPEERSAVSGALMNAVLLRRGLLR